MSSEDLFVTIAIPEGTEIKLKKDILIKSSPVFKAMLEDKNWKEGNENKILIKEIPFAKIDSFNFLGFFARIIKQDGGDNYQWTAWDRHILYAWAHYYQVEFQDEILKSLADNITNDRIPIATLSLYVDFAKNFGLEDFKSKLYSQKLKVTTYNCFDFYKIVIKYENESWINQVVDFVADNFEPDDTWPAGLVFKVIKRLKSRISQLSLVGEGPI